MVCVLTVIKKTFRKNLSSHKLGGQISVLSQLDENAFKKETNKNQKKKIETQIHYLMGKCLYRFCKG